MMGLPPADPAVNVTDRYESPPPTAEMVGAPGRATGVTAYLANGGTLEHA